MGRHRRRPVADPFDDRRGNRVGDQLDGKVDGRQHRDLPQRHPVIRLEGLTEERREVVDNRLDNIPDKTGDDRMVCSESGGHNASCKNVHGKGGCKPAGWYKYFFDYIFRYNFMIFSFLEDHVIKIIKFLPLSLSSTIIYICYLFVNL